LIAREHAYVTDAGTTIAERGRYSPSTASRTRPMPPSVRKRNMSRLLVEELTGI
jgi:hypothetical protein